MKLEKIFLDYLYMYKNINTENFMHKNECKEVYSMHISTLTISK